MFRRTKTVSGIPLLEILREKCV